MNQVSIQYIEELLSPLIGEADNDNFFNKYVDYSYDLDGNDVKIVKEILLSEISPYWNTKDDCSKNRMKKSLSYYLTTNKVNFGRLYDSNLLPFNHPDNPRDFFVWLWEILFPEESYLIEDLSNYIEIND